MVLAKQPSFCHHSSQLGLHLGLLSSLGRNLARKLGSAPHMFCNASFSSFIFAASRSCQSLAGFPSRSGCGAGAWICFETVSLTPLQASESMPNAFPIWSRLVDSTSKGGLGNLGTLPGRAWLTVFAPQGCAGAWRRLTLTTECGLTSSFGASAIVAAFPLRQNLATVAKNALPHHLSLR